MKKSIPLFIVILLFSFNLFSQTSYYKMLGNTNRWYVSGYAFGVKSSGTQNTTGIGGPCIGYYKANRDSVYGSKLYKVFEQDQIMVCFFTSAPPLMETLIREDTVLKKIFMIHPDSVNECVAMDFGMNVGDSIYLPYATNSYPLKNGYYKLDSINSKQEVLGLRRHFYLSKFDAPINFLTPVKYYVEWIESIGATHFPINIIEENQTADTYMPFSCNANQYTSYVTCKYSDGIKQYQDSCALKFANTHSGYILFGDNCEFYGFAGRIKELSFLNEIELFPNPVSSSELTLKFKARSYKPIHISIYNSLGQKIYLETINISNTDTEIKLLNLNFKQGLYNLHLKSEDESSSINFIKN